MYIDINILTGTIAVVGAIIGVLQYRLANIRWRLDLYNKRYPVYTSTMTFISSICQKANCPHESSFQFLRETKDMEFLFDDDVRTHLDCLYKQAIDLETTRSMMEPLPVGEERTRLANKQCELLKWFGSQLQVTKCKFRPYLEITRK